MWLLELATLIIMADFACRVQRGDSFVLLELIEVQHYLGLIFMKQIAYLLQEATQQNAIQLLCSVFGTYKKEEGTLSWQILVETPIAEKSRCSS